MMQTRSDMCTTRQKSECSQPVESTHFRKYAWKQSRYAHTNWTRPWKIMWTCNDGLNSIIRSHPINKMCQLQTLKQPQAHSCCVKLSICLLEGGRRVHFLSGLSLNHRTKVDTKLFANLNRIGQDLVRSNGYCLWFLTGKSWANP